MSEQKSKVETMAQSFAEKLRMPMKGVYLLCLIVIGVLLLIQKEPLNGIMYGFGMSLTEFKVLLVFLHVYALAAIVMACDAVAISSAAKAMLFFLGAAIITYMNEKDFEKMSAFEPNSVPPTSPTSVDESKLRYGITSRTGWYYVLVLFSFVSFLFAGAAEPSIYGRAGFFVFSLLPLLGLLSGPPAQLLES